MLAKAFQHEGVPVHEADEEIHRLFEEDRDVQKDVRALWPGVFENGKISRQKLRQKVLPSPQGLNRLEKILYPKLLKQQIKFIKRGQNLKKSMVVLDVPLLFETGLHRYCHFVIVVSSPSFLRTKRVLRRKGVTSEDYENFEFHQLSALQKEQGADLAIRTGRDKGSALKEIKKVLAYLTNKPIPCWSGRWPVQLQREPYDKRSRLRYRNNRV